MGGGYHIFIPVLGGGGTKKVSRPPVDMFDQPSVEMKRTRGKLADHVGDHVVLSQKGAVLVISPGTEYSNTPPII